MTGKVDSWPWLCWFWSILVIAGLPPAMSCSGLTLLGSGLSLTLVWQAWQLAMALQLMMVLAVPGYSWLTLDWPDWILLALVRLWSGSDLRRAWQ